MPSDLCTDHQLSTVERSRPVRRMILFREFYRGRCAKSTAYGWIKAGKLRTYKVGGLVYVDLTYDEFIRQAADNEAA